MNIFQRISLGADFVAVFNEVTNFKNNNSQDVQELIELCKIVVEKAKKLMPNVAQSLENIKRAFCK